MTLYKFYIAVPEDLRNATRADAERYRYVASNISSNSYLYDEKTKMKIYLYAFTNKKEYSIAFESTHDMNIFKKVKQKVTKKEYLNFRYGITEKELVRTEIDPFEKDEEPVAIICPKFEISDIEENTEYYQNDVMINTAFGDYRLLKDDYVKFLDKIGYCNFASRNLNEEMTDYASYNESFGISAEGYNSKYNGLRYNKFKIYIMLFEYILKKEKVG